MKYSHSNNSIDFQCWTNYRMDSNGRWLQQLLSPRVNRWWWLSRRDHRRQCHDIWRPTDAREQSAALPGAREPPVAVDLAWYLCLKIWAVPTTTIDLNQTLSNTNSNQLSFVVRSYSYYNWCFQTWPAKINHELHGDVHGKIIHGIWKELPCLII